MTTYRTIADLPTAGAAATNDLIELEQGGTSRRVTVGQLFGGVRVSAATFGCSPAASAAINTAAIQQALDLAGEVELPAGVIQLDNVALIPRSNTNLWGHGNGTILARTGNDPGPSSYVKPFFDILDVHDVTFDGITIQHVYVSSREYGMRFGATTLGSTYNIRIRNCTFLNAGNHIQRFVKQVWWTDNVFDGQAGAIYGFATGGDVTSGALVPTDGLVEKIYAYGNVFKDIRTEGIDINMDTAHVVIDGNSFIDCNNAGSVLDEAIDIGGVNSMATGCRYVTVSNNNITWTTAKDSIGITCKVYSDNVTITGNTLYNATTTSGTVGIFVTDFVRNITISGNTVRGFRTSISLSGSTMGTSENITIVGNAVHDAAGVGINVVTGVWTNVVIKGNTVQPQIASASQGIVLANVTRWLVEGNLVRGVTGQCISITATATDGTVSNNNVSGSNSDGINIAGPRVGVTGNLTYFNGRNGINIGATALNATVVGNTIYNNSQVLANQFGLLIAAGAHYCTIMANNVFDDQGTKTQNGIVFGAVNNITLGQNNVGPVKATIYSGLTSITSSTVSFVAPNTTLSATIATGVVTAFPGCVILTVDTEGAAATDDLDTITYTGVSGDRLTVNAASTARDVVLKHATGNMQLGADITLNNNNDTVLLQWTGTLWRRLSSADNGA